MSPAHRYTSQKTPRALSRLSVLLDDSNTGVLFGAIILTAAAVMFGAIFSPFVTDGCISCPLDYTFPTRSVFQSLDGWIILLVMAALLLSAAYLRHRRQRGFAIACVLLAASAVGLCIFERSTLRVASLILAEGVHPSNSVTPAQASKGFFPLFTPTSVFISC